MSSAGHWSNFEADRADSPEPGSLEREIEDIEKSAADLWELICRVRRLVDQHKLPAGDLSSEVLDQAEATLAEQLELVRGERKRFGPLRVFRAADSAAREVLDTASQLIRRAALLMELQLFRLDGMVERAPQR